MINRFYIQFLAIIFAGLGIYYILSSGLYPIAIVNRHWISARAFRQDHAIAQAYYGTVVKAKNADELLKEIKRATLDKVIENELVYQELQKRLGTQLSAAVEKVVSDGTKDKPQLATAVQKIYGIGFDQFKDLVLVPEARIELLESRLSDSQETLAGWLIEKRKDASIILLTTEFGWDGMEIVLK